MNAFLLLKDETEAASEVSESFDVVKLSRTEVAINHWIDIAEVWLDYIVTPLLGPNQSAGR